MLSPVVVRVAVRCIYLSTQLWISRISTNEENFFVGAHLLGIIFLIQRVHVLQKYICIKYATGNSIPVYIFLESVDTKCNVVFHHALSVH